MRRLLLLLLTFLLPLHLLAATMGDLPSCAGPGNGFAATCSENSSSHDSMPVADAAGERAFVSSLHAALEEPPQPAVAAADQPVDDDDSDAPATMADCEDHVMPVRIATPDAVWRPFPHLFAAPLSWPSFVRDQLRPPPLA